MKFSNLHLLFLPTIREWNEMKMINLHYIQVEKRLTKFTVTQRWNLPVFCSVDPAFNRQHRKLVNSTSMRCTIFKQKEIYEIYENYLELSAKKRVLKDYNIISEMMSTQCVLLKPDVHLFLYLSKHSSCGGLWPFNVAKMLIKISRGFSYEKSLNQSLDFFTLISK